MEYYYKVMDLKSQKEIFESISELLVDNKMVTPNYYRALTEREQLFPTGLETAVLVEEGINVAIPHVEPEYCLQDGLVFVLNSAAIEWKDMVKKEDLKVRFFVFIISSNGEEHMRALPMVIELFKNQKFQTAVTKVTNDEQLMKLINKYIEEKYD